MKNFVILLLLGATSAIQLHQEDPEEDAAMAAVVSCINAETQEEADN